MRPSFLFAANRRWRAGAGILLAALAASACTPPPHAAVVRCSGSGITSVAPGKDCTIAIAKFDRQASARIRLDTSRRQAFVRGRFTVQQGTVRIELRGNAGTKAEVLVTPETPGALESTLRLDRQGGSFHLRFHPEGEVAGLEGAVSGQAR